MHRLPSKPHAAQRGSVLIWMAFFLVVMLMFIALGIDMAKLMATRTQLQNAADAAALAGASAFKDTTGVAGITSLATTRALQTAALNTAFQAAATPVLVFPADVFVNTDSMTVRVITRREQAAGGTGMVTQFLRVIGLWTLDMRAAATARADKAPCDLVPLAVQAPTGKAFQVGCANVYTIKEAPPNGTTGGYGGLDFGGINPPCPADPCSGGGANRYRCEVTNGWPCCLDSLACVPSEQGNMSGPTQQAIAARFAADTDKREDICYSEYQGNGSRVVTTPLTGPKQGSGAGCYLVNGFGSFFIRKIPGNGGQNFISAEYLGDLHGGPGVKDFSIRLIR